MKDSTLKSSAIEMSGAGNAAGPQLFDALSVLREKQGFFESVKTGLTTSGSAGQALRDIEKERHLAAKRIASMAIDMITDATLKEIVSKHGALRQSQLERLVGMEMDGNRRVGALGAEGMLRQQVSYQSQTMALVALAERGEICRAGLETGVESLAKLDGIVRERNERAIEAAFEDLGHIFSGARAKFSNR